VQVSAQTGFFTELAQADEVLRLSETATSASEVGLISSQMAEQWLGDLASADHQGLFFAAMTGFLVTGRKPG
jgi:hypothetical protein